MTYIRQSKEFARFMRLSGWIVKKANNCYIYIRRIPLFPPLIMKIQYPTPPIPFAQIEKLTQKYRPLKIQIQPLKIERGLAEYHYQPSKETSHVTKTIQIDLVQSETKLMKQMKKDARYGIRKAKEKEIKIFRNLEIEKFRKVWRKSIGWQRYVPSLKTLLNLKKVFGANAIFLIAKKGKDTSDGGPPAGGTPPRWREEYSAHKISAGTVILIANQIAYYYYAFTSKTGRKNYAQYLLVWEAIKEAKRRNCKTFDFEGIYDPRFPNKSWRGFTHFKRSFGGREVKYPGCFVQYRSF